MSDKCPNCGAPLRRAADGRRDACGYCGLDADAPVDPASIAASLHADCDTLEKLFDRLATHLADQLPELVVVRMGGGGFFSSAKPIAVEISFGADTLVLAKDGRRVTGSRKKVVRGIQLKSEQLPLDQWVEALAAGLAATADASAAARDALHRLAKS